MADYSAAPYAKINTIAGSGCDTKVFSVVPISPFREYTPRVATIRAVVLTRENAVEIAYRMMAQGAKDVIFSSSERSLTYNGTRFDVGDWIVEESHNLLTCRAYRHATEEEVATYQLTGK